MAYVMNLLACLAVLLIVFSIFLCVCDQETHENEKGWRGGKKGGVVSDEKGAVFVVVNWRFLSQFLAGSCDKIYHS